MDDEIAVSVRHGGQNVEEQPDALLDAETALSAVLIDALAPHVFQNEVRLAICLDTGIQQPRDVRMLQASEHASLTRKPLLRGMADQSRVQQFHCHLAFESTIAAMGEPDGAHAAESRAAAPACTRPRRAP